MGDIKKVLVINEALSHNIGDRAIAAGLATALKSVVGEQTEIIRFWLQKGVFADAHQTPAQQTGKSDSGSMQVSFPYHVLWTIRYLFRLLAALRKLSQADVAIFGGGSLIMDNRLQFPTAMYLLGVVLRLFNIPYNVSGVSLSGEISGLSKVLFHRFLKGARHVDMRDPISREKAEKLFGMSVDVGSDYAFCLNEIPATSTEKKYDYLLNITSAVKDRSEYASFVRRFLEAFSDKKILIATTGDSGDENLARELHAESRHPALEILLANNFDDYCRGAALSKDVIASRLHSGILPVSMGVATVILDVGYKQRGFFNGVGLESRVFDFHESIDSLVSIMKPMSSEDRLELAKRQRDICHGNIGKIFENCRGWR